MRFEGVDCMSHARAAARGATFALQFVDGGPALAAQQADDDFPVREGRAFIGDFALAWAFFRRGHLRTHAVVGRSLDSSSGRGRRAASITCLHSASRGRPHAPGRCASDRCILYVASQRQAPITRRGVKSQ